MKLLLTGATGRVDRHLLPRLVAQGHDVRAVARDEAGARKVKAAGAEPVLADLLEPAGYRDALPGRNAVVHLAAVLRSTDADEIRRANLDATRRLADAALETGVDRFVAASTTLVYPGGLGRPATEDDQPAPPAVWGVYPATKAEADRALLDLHRDRGLACGSSASPSSTARATRTWPSRCSGPAGGPGTSGCSCSTTPTPPRPWPACCRPPASTGGSTALPTSPRSPPWSARPQRRALPRPPGRPARPVARHRRHHPHPREPGFRPWYPSVWSARDAGAL